MKNALKIGSVSRINIYVHWTFGLLIAGLFAFYMIRGESVHAALAGVGLIVAVFGCVILHELGHAVTARRFDVATRDITLYPIGGVARLQRIPDEPMKEFWIAVAGPAVNLGIALVLLLVVGTLGLQWSPQSLLEPGKNFVATLMWLNVVLVAFNLLPAFPMDGGRVLRSLLATHLDYARATQIAANVGQTMAILFGLLGIVSFNPILLFIALFVYVGAQQEAQQAMMRAVTGGIAVRQAMMTRFQILPATATLDDAIGALLAGADQDFPVLAGDDLVGVLTRKRLMKALAEHGRTAPIRDFVDDCFTVPDNAMLEEAFIHMNEAGCSTVPVYRNGAIVGLLTLENVGELLMIATALKKAGTRSELESVVRRGAAQEAGELVERR